MRETHHKNNRALYDVTEKGVIIDLSVLRRFVVARLSYMAFAIPIGLLLAVLLFFTQETMYCAETELTVEMPENMLSGDVSKLGLLKSLTPFVQDDSPKKLYQRVESGLLSTKYLLRIMDTAIYFSSVDKKQTLSQFLTRKNKARRDGQDSVTILLNNGIKLGSYQHKITKNKLDALHTFTEYIEIEPMDEGIANQLTLSITLPDPYAAFELTDIILQTLPTYLTSLQTTKETQKLVYVEQKFRIAKKEYSAARRKQAKFAAKNAHVTSYFVRLTKEQLSFDTKFKFNIYNQLGLQYEQMKVELHNKRILIIVDSPTLIPEPTWNWKHYLVFGVVVGVFLGGFLIFAVLGICLLGYEKYLPRKQARLV